MKTLDLLFKQTGKDVGLSPPPKKKKKSPKLLLLVKLHVLGFKPR